MANNDMNCAQLIGELMHIAPLVHLIIDYCYDCKHERKERTVMYFQVLAAINRQCYQSFHGGNETMWSSEPPIYFSLSTSDEYMFSKFVETCRFQHLHLSFKAPKIYEGLIWEKFTKLNLRMLTMEYDIDLTWSHSVNLLSVILSILETFERLNHLRIHVRQSSGLSSSRFTKKHKFNAEQASIKFNRSLSLRSFELKLENHEWIQEPIKLRIPQFLRFLISISPRLERLTLVPFENYCVLSDDELLQELENVELSEISLFNISRFDRLQELLDSQSESLSKVSISNAITKKPNSEAINFAECSELQSLDLNLLNLSLSNVPMSVDRLKLNSCFVDPNDFDPSNVQVLKVDTCKFMSTIVWDRFRSLRKLTISHSFVLSSREFDTIVNSCPLEYISLDTASFKLLNLLHSLLNHSRCDRLRTIHLNNDRKVIGTKMRKDGPPIDIEITAIKKVTLSNLHSATARELYYFFSSKMFSNVREFSIERCSDCSVLEVMECVSQYCRNISVLNVVLNSSCPTGQHVVPRFRFLHKLRKCNVICSGERSTFELQILTILCTFHASLESNKNQIVHVMNDAGWTETMKIINKSDHNSSGSSKWKLFVDHTIQTIHHLINNNQFLTSDQTFVNSIVTHLDNCNSSYECTMDQFLSLYNGFLRACNLS